MTEQKFFTKTLNIAGIRSEMSSAFESLLTQHINFAKKNHLHFFGTKDLENIPAITRWHNTNLYNGTVFIYGLNPFNKANPESAEIYMGQEIRTYELRFRPLLERLKIESLEYKDAQMFSFGIPIFPEGAEIVQKYIQLTEVFYLLTEICATMPKGWAYNSEISPEENLAAIRKAKNYATPTDDGIIPNIGSYTFFDGEIVVEVSAEYIKVLTFPIWMSEQTLQGLLDDYIKTKLVLSVDDVAC